MAITVGGVAIDLSAESALILREMDKAGRAVSKAAQDMQTSGNRMTRTFSGLESRLSRFGNFMRSTFAGIGAALITRRVVQYGDAWALAQGRLRLATGSTEELQQVTEDLFRVAQRSRTAFDPLVNLYTRMQQATAHLGLSSRELIGLTEGVSQAIRISGTSAAGASAVIEQFAQSLSEGAFRGDELNTISGQANRLLQALIRGYQELYPAVGLTNANYRKLASEGLLTTDKNLRAILSQLPELQKEFDTLGITVGEAFTKLDNAVAKLIGSTDQAVGGTGALAQAISGLADSLESPRLATAIDFFIAKWKEFRATTMRELELVTRAIEFMVERWGAFWQTSLKEFNAFISGWNAVAGKLNLPTFDLFDLTGPEFTDAEAQLAALDAKLARLRSSSGNFTAEIAAGEAQRQKLIDQIQLAATEAQTFQDRLAGASVAVGQLSAAGSGFTPPAMPSLPAARPSADILSLPRIGEVIGPPAPPPFMTGPPAPTPPKPRFVTNPPLPPPEKPITPEIEAQLARAEDATHRFGQTFENVFTSVLDPTRNFVDTLKDLPNILANLVIQMTIIEPIARALAASLSGALFGPAGGAGGAAVGGLLSFQHGGNYPAGRLALVGEAGPELFASRSGGRVFDARMTRDILSGGSGGTTNINVDARNALPGVKAEVFNSISQALPLIKADVSEDHTRRRGSQGASR